jgi:dienelactone hydrolase
MKCVFSVALVVLSVLNYASAAEDKERESKLKAKVAAFFAALSKEDYEGASKDFDDAVRKALPTEKVKDLWLTTLPKQVGELKKRGDPRIEKVGKYDVVVVPCTFEKMALDARFSFNSEDKIAGLRFVPSASTEYKPPDYVKRDAFREIDLKLNEGGEWELPGTLSIPIDTGLFPAVILIHGSGPNDRDETILANKPFRDLAWGLASRGIAVYRFDKRTRIHGTKLKGDKFPTVKEEVTDDALAAVALLRKTKEIDPKRVFVLGHSLGALMAPRIGKADSNIAGLVVMAGNARPLEDLVLEQFTYLYSLDGGPTEEQKKELEEIKKKCARVKEPGLNDATPGTELPLGVPGAYWLSLRDYHPDQLAAQLTMPFLVLQGERDYQVTMADFKLWEKSLTGRPKATLKSYPKLNHLFIEGDGKSKPDEYLKAGHVAREVIDDIAGWIKKQ